MFIKNTTNKDIKLTSFEGYEFLASPGVSAIWDKAGDFWVDLLAPKGENGKAGHRDGNIIFTPVATTIPGIIVSDKKEWAAGGKKMTQVTRFQILTGMIPRASLIEIAGQRGVALEKTQGNKTDDDILQAINELPVPEEIRFPHLNENE